MAKVGTAEAVLGGAPPNTGGQPRGFWRQFLVFTGPGYLVATGYMDPGNWATSIAGGSTFGYQLLFVALFSSLMAIVMQSLAARLGIASNRDLAEMCREALPLPLSLFLWVLAELAICATDLAEVIGTAIGLNLLFGIPIGIGTLLTAADVFLILALQRLGFRWIEAFVMALLILIAACFFGPSRSPTDYSAHPTSGTGGSPSTSVGSTATTSPPPCRFPLRVRRRRGRQPHRCYCCVY